MNIIKPHGGLYYDKSHWTMRNSVLMFCPLWPGDLTNRAYSPIGTAFNVVGDVTAVGSEYGPAFDFAGSDDYVECGPDTTMQGTTELTLEVLVKFDAVGSVMAMFRDSDSWTKNSIYFIVEADGSIECLVYNSGYDRAYSTAGDIVANTWYHLVATWKQSELLELYINGINSTDNRAGSTRTTAMMAGDENLSIGISPGDNVEEVDGKIAMVRLHDRKFGGNEIAELARDPWAAWRQDDIDVFATAASSAGGGSFIPAWAMNSNQIVL